MDTKGTEDTKETEEKEGTEEKKRETTELEDIFFHYIILFFDITNPKYRNLVQKNHRIS